MSPRFRSSLAIRLTAALIAVTFLATASVLAGIYYFSVSLPMAEIRKEVATETTKLESIHAKQGVERLAAALEARRDVPSPSKPFDALIDRDGRLVTGNLPSWPQIGSRDWVNIEADLYRDGDEDDHEALSLDVILPDGRRLIVGRDVEVLADRRELMGEAAMWGSISVLLFGLLGGALISWITARRLDAVSRTARSVMNGDLSVRVPLQGSGDEFDRLGLTLNAMLDRNMELMASVARVSDNIAHELRTPLARLSAALDTNEVGNIDPDRAEIIRSEAKRLHQIFDALLRIARLDTGRHRINRQPIRFDQLVGDAVELYGPEAEAKKMAFNMAAVPCTVKGDRDLLFQAVTNLIDNALKFAPRGGTVQADVGIEDSVAVLTVKDNGPGVPKEHRPRLTERFFRAPGSEAKAGTGLGLTLASAIADAHGGSLTFPDADDGFAVSLRLPLVRTQ